MTIHAFDNAANTQLSAIVASIALNSSTSGAVLADLQTNGAGQLACIETYANAIVFTASSNQSAVVFDASNVTTSEFVAPVICTDANNIGYRPTLGGVSGSTFDRVVFTREGAFAASVYFTTPIDSVNGLVEMRLSQSGADVVCAVYQDGSLYETLSWTDPTPLTRTGAGFVLKRDTADILLEAWNDYAANMPPVFGAAIDDISISEGTTGSFNVGSSVTDPEGDTITFSVNPALPTGVTLNSATGVISSDNTQVQTASAQYTLTADDGQGNTATATFNLEVTPPVLTIDAVSNLTPIEETQIVIDFSNAQGVLTAGDFNIANQDGAQATIDIPNLRSFILSGQTYPTLNYSVDVTIPISDGVTTANVVVPISPKAADRHGAIESTPEGSRYLRQEYVDAGLAIGDFVHTTNINNITFDISTGLATSDSSGGSLDIAFYSGGEWGSSESIVIPPFPSSLIVIDSIVPNKTGATVNHSYSETDVTSFEYRIDDGAWLTASSPLSITGLTSDTAYTLSLRPLLDGYPGNETTVAFTTDPAVDTRPDPFSFVAQTDVATEFFVVSNEITVNGVDAGVDIPLTVTNGEHSISSDGGSTWSAFSSADTNVRLNYRVRIRHLSSSSYSATTTTTADIGGESGSLASTTVADTEAPVFTLTNGNVSVVEGGTWVEPGFTCVDDADGVIPANEVTITGTVNMNVPGTYTLTYSATDSAGNTGTASRIVTVTPFVPSDTAPPVISLNGGNISINVGDEWVEPGYSAVDNVDGDITANVSVTGTVNTAVAGVYTLTYAVSDAAGNSASVTRSVTVVAAIVYPLDFEAPDSRTYIATRIQRIEAGEAIFIKQSDEILDYDFDLTEWLASQNDTLPDGNFGVDTGSSDLAVVAAGNVPGTNRIKVWIEGGSHGAHGMAYPVELTVVTARFRAAKFLLRIAVIDKV